MHNLYYMDISKTKVDDHCYFNTMKKGNIQEQCIFPSIDGFINALECNAIKGVAFGRRDVKIANEIYGYSKDTADGKVKHPQKEIKMDRTIEDITGTVLLKLTKHYKYIHLDIDLLFLNGVAFLLVKSKYIESIYCKAILSKSYQQVINGLKSIILDYEARKFKVTTVFLDVAFKPINNWMGQELYADLITFPLICFKYGHAF